MMKYSRILGMEDIYPDKSAKWDYIIETAKNVSLRYNYRHIITPLLEYTELFKRGIGDETDIVSKEMYTFEDRGGRSLTLRPEGTASVVRAYCENGDYNRLSSCKFFYFGQMFRAEKPQKGRLRQFNQFGIEFFGEDDPYYDFEAVSLMNTITMELKISDYELHINSIGCSECRPEYIKKLKDYYSEHLNELCEECKRRLEKNPLRLLDCKNEKCSILKNNAPKINEHLCSGCGNHHEVFKNYMKSAGIKYVENPYLVRGLDYYCKTTFEFISPQLGSQGTFAGGGRYNTLVEMFGGKPTPAVGFGAGLERLLLIIEDRLEVKNNIDIYIIHSGEQTLQKAVQISEELRSSGFSVDLEPGRKGFKSQFSKADKWESSYALIIGEEEISQGKCSVKNLSSGIQENIEFSSILSYFRNRNLK
ncbi:MAG: histidine--tRNA ligase [Spirochaetes bacterium]|nr:histidine--tRNA ligase [Spirochaetota bacterium]